MTDTFRALCAELTDTLDYWLKNSNLTDSDARDLVEEARAALAQPEPVALTRPECFDFAMDFLGDPEETEVRRYVEALEARTADERTLYHEGRLDAVIRHRQQFLAIAAELEEQ